MNSGIYQIRNKRNRFSYVGLATNIKARWGAHKSCLRRGTHPNRKLQKDWDKYGEATFVFEILEYV